MTRPLSRSETAHGRNLPLVVLVALASSGLAGPEPAAAEDVAATSYHLVAGQSPTALTVTNTTANEVYVNLVLGLPPDSPPNGCTDLGTQFESLTDPNLVFRSSVTGKTVTFTGPPGVDVKGAYEMDAGETITYVPQTFSCFGSQTCTPALTFNFFFTVGFNGTQTGNNGCGGAGTTYPNATNLAEGSINFSANGAVGSTCASADDTDISAVNGVNATLGIDTSDPGTGASWPPATSIAKNGTLGENVGSPGVFGWAATNCTNPEGFPNPSCTCPAPVDAPVPVQGACPAPTTLITGPDGNTFCAQTSATGTCNNQRPAFNTGGTIKITYHGPIAASVRPRR